MSQHSGQQHKTLTGQLFALPRQHSSTTWSLVNPEQALLSRKSPKSRGDECVVVKISSDVDRTNTTLKWKTLQQPNPFHNSEAISLKAFRMDLLLYLTSLQLI